MARIGWLTCSTLAPFAHSKETSLLTHDDALAVDRLRQRGHEIVPLPWQEAHQHGAFDLILQRSPWDYMQTPDAYQDTLERFETNGTPVLNNLTTTRWNIDKHYLLELAEKGAPTLPTICIEPDDTEPLLVKAQRQGWKELVLKPCISAGAFLTFRKTLDELGTFQSEFDTFREQRAFLFQPFLPEILTQGEWSFVFFGETYSHAVRKRAKQGDYRVQDDHGGTVHFDPPPPALIQQARHTLTLLPELPLYARIDGVDVHGTFHLIEMELIEPELFFRASPNAPTLFANALEAKLSL